MNIKDKVRELLKYCSVYQGHVNMMDERREDRNFQVMLPEEKEIREALGNLQFILLTGEAGDGKSRLIRTLLPELNKHGFKIYPDFSAEPEGKKKEIIKRIAGIVEGESQDHIIIAANVGIFTRTVLQYQGSLMDKLSGRKDKVKIINFEKRNLAWDKEVFAQIVQAFLAYDKQPCEDKACRQCEACIFQKNLDFLQSQQGIESVRVICDAVSLVGEHITFRELLSMLAYMVTFGESCEERRKRADASNCSYENIFAYHENYDKVLMNISRMDPAYCNFESGQGEYEYVQVCRSKKRLRFFERTEQKYEFLSVDYLAQFQRVIRRFQEEPYIESEMIQEGELYRLKRGLLRLTRRGQSDLSMKVVDTPAMLGDDIQTEFELGDIEIIWHRYGLDFKCPGKEEHCPEERNRFAMSYVYEQEDGQPGAITLVINYRLFRYLMLADDYYYLSHNSKSIEEYTINTFFRKILKKKKGAYEKMTVRFANKGQGDLCDFSLKLQEKRSLISGNNKAIKIKREG